jgi:thiosulfate/3-mercaptopyruvate sulfurtransferase
MPETNLLIDCAKLARVMDDPGVRVIDCRFELLDRDAGQRRYVEGHLPGAVFADLDRDLAAPVTSGTGRHPLPDASIMAGTFARLGISNSSRVVVYDDDNGALASRCWWLLRWLGHDDARLLDGGFARWRSLGLPIEAGDRQPAAVDFRPSPRPELVLETQEIAAAGTNRAALQLVDARDSARFAGRHEPIDPVAGHIPGAINLPFPASLDAHGGWRSATELQKLWRRTLGDGFGRPWSTMCGSGVTACHLVVSGLLAGLPEPRVYVGSWSEWITDTSRPVAVGEG